MSTSDGPATSFSTRPGDNARSNGAGVSRTSSRPRLDDAAGVDGGLRGTAMGLRMGLEARDFAGAGVAPMEGLAGKLFTLLTPPDGFGEDGGLCCEVVGDTMGDIGDDGDLASPGTCKVLDRAGCLSGYTPVETNSRTRSSIKNLIKPMHTGVSLATT